MFSPLVEHYGNKKKANGEGSLSEDEAMKRCKSLLAQLKEEQAQSKAWLEVRRGSCKDGDCR